ncbi:lipocalin family protein [uncultured Winogradskyella sp.]|uniref:lipocalin family protein n=1 Tax=uncultured Winogradskyella sp. TaxID=395353 RepID=UPI002621446E|nr:lipocalin family protein [uncultured Winogradskyella sp.]
MKKLSIFLVLLLVLVSCDSDDDNVELIGDWQLVEVLADPGDGSGTFTPVTSSKMMTFNTDGTVTSNGIMCDIVLNTNTQSNGTYSSERLFFQTDACGLPDNEYTFEINGDLLTFFVPCIEPCGARYRKL